MDGILSEIIAANRAFENLAPNTHEYLRDLKASLAPDVIRPISKYIVRGETKKLNVDFPDELTTDWPYLELIQLSDVQFGHRDCKLETLAKYIEWILSKPYRFICNTGDAIDAAHAFTPGSPWDNIFEAQSELCSFARIMAPVRHRWLGYVGGNHERRGIPVFGDLGKLIACMLEVPYSGGRQFIDIRYRSHESFKVALWHGHPRARTKGALAQIMDRYTKIGNAHLYYTGHNHQCLVVPDYREIVQPDGLKLEMYVGASGTSFLRTYGSYGEWMGFGAYNVIMPRARLYPNGEWELVVKACD